MGITGVNKIIVHHWRCLGGYTSGVRHGHANDRDSSQNSSVEVLYQCDRIWRAFGRQLCVSEVMRSAPRMGSVLLVEKEGTAEILLSACVDTLRRQLSAIWGPGPRQGHDHAVPGLAAPRTARYTLLLLKHPVLCWRGRIRQTSGLSYWLLCFRRLKKKLWIVHDSRAGFSSNSKAGEPRRILSRKGGVVGAAARLLLGIHYWGQCHRDQVKTGCIALWTQLALLDIQALDLNAFPSPL